jgi:hypothetical protein
MGTMSSSNYHERPGGVKDLLPALPEPEQAKTGNKPAGLALLVVRSVDTIIWDYLNEAGKFNR